ncbi:hypothetical protein PQX77_009637 [Marasmius sp. AFHP31]|nr:hypothetical protein PQX77_009637 [Marasmius sp. AFHP31]
MPRPGETRGEFRIRREAAAVPSQQQGPRQSQALRQQPTTRQPTRTGTGTANQATVEDEQDDEAEEPQALHQLDLEVDDLLFGLINDMEEEPRAMHSDIDELFHQLVQEIDAMYIDEPEEGSSKQRMRRPNVMLPKVTTLPPVHDVPDVRSSSERKNPQHQAEQRPSIYYHHLKNGFRFIQKFILPLTYAELVDQARAKNREKTIKKLEEDVQEMEAESYAIQAGSALFYTSDKVLVFVYLGWRTSDMTSMAKDEFLNLSQCSMEERLQSTLEHKEEEIRTAREQILSNKAKRRKHRQRPSNTQPLKTLPKFYNDGFTQNMTERLYVSSHFMAAYNGPKGDTTTKRHGIDHDGYTYHYFDLEKGIEFTAEEKQSRNMVFSEDGGKTALQPAGVFHMAEAWPQQRHKKKELYMGSALSGSGQSTLATRYFYQANETLEKCVEVAVNQFFPEIHDIGVKVREAGRTIPTSDGQFCGMYLARAIIFKLQVLLHKDDNDFGVSTSFPCGYFEGGYLIVPQLKSKFRYAPGDLAIFYANLLFHKVMRWKAPKMKKDDNIAPGRVGVVMFNPSASVEELKDKEVKHSERTVFGKMPNIGPERMEMQEHRAKKQRTK